jgi:glutathione peroxidase
LVFVTGRGYAALLFLAMPDGFMGIYDTAVTTLAGQPQTLAEFRGQVLLIVNVASKCGFTPQYQGLEALYRRYRERGFAVLGFPCNQFGAQEPGAAEEIRQFCTSRYEVSFPMFAKLDVNGAHAHPLYRLLKSARPGILGTEGIKWNFTKFLIERSGAIAQRFAPTDKPESLAGAIEQRL